MIARVAGVIRRSASAGSIWKVRGSTSTNTGRAPARTTAVAEPMKVMSGTSTSSPGPTPNAISPSARANVPLGASTP